MNYNYVFITNVGVIVRATVRVSRTVLGKPRKVFVRHEHGRSSSHSMRSNQQAINSQQSYYKQAYTNMVFVAKEHL